MTEFETPKINSYGEPIGWLLLAFYMLIANIMMLNLLIAIFGYGLFYGILNAVLCLNSLNHNIWVF